MEDIIIFYVVVELPGQNTPVLSEEMGAQPGNQHVNL